ncbi:TIR domain-containing protein [Flavobacterium sp. ZS1P70]|uniref:TIR domain-containing protein n=1 Tax=Flavobacterium zhoui TaxID=3230414 RepID=A0ABW6I7F3_9FLAO
MHDKVFISYAKEDFAFAEKLHDFLEENSFRPWLDKKALLPGQDWNFIIRKALREANYIILLLSSNSVQKRGYIQREFKLALEYYEEKLEEDIYLIPLKINDCEVPDRLSKFQWVEYDSKNCFNLVLTSLSIQRQKYVEFDNKQIAQKELFEYEEKEEVFEYFNKIRFDINNKYFQFIDESNPNLNELNQIIKGKKIEHTTFARKQFHEITGKLIKPYSLQIGWSFDVTFFPNLITKSIVSLSEDSYAYSGGAHGLSYIKAYNYILNPVFEITLDDLFEYDDHETILNFLSNYCYEELRKRYNEWTEPTEQELEEQTPNTLFWEDSLSPEWDKFSNFFISKNDLEIIFNTYSVSGFAFGIQIIPIPYKKILPLLKKSKNLKELIKKLK